MALGEAAGLLARAYGISGLNQVPNVPTIFARPVPSAGGLYPLELYAATRDVDGVADGIYHYSILYHRLEQVRPGPVVQEIGTYLLGQYYLQNANLVLFLSAVFARTLKKYGPRGYRYILLEAGHCAQNLCLLAAERGLATLCLGGFQDTKLNRLLGLDGTTEAVVYCLGVGYAAE
jgi:SagB-type dehydrogenase family enzyme